MLTIGKAHPSQVLSDKVLLQFETYEAYLDHLVQPEDLNNLRSTLTARSIVENSLRSTSVALTREQFTKRRRRVQETFFPVRNPKAVVSAHIPMHAADTFIRDLAKREEGNRRGHLATIIFIRLINRQKQEISGYIDYTHRLVTEDWTPIFQGRRRIIPRTTDLSYYNWKTGDTYSNSSPYFRRRRNPTRGLLFQHRQDGKVMSVNPFEMTFTDMRTRSVTSLYLHAVFYDHEVQLKL